MSQFALTFEGPADPRDDEFLVSSSNAAAVHTLEHWGAWPVMTPIVVGPRKSGRTLLARIFVANSPVSIIDDADPVAETDLFHAWTRAHPHRPPRSEAHTSELQSLMRNPDAVFRLKQNNKPH